jgi:hypothetical protein
MCFFCGREETLEHAMFMCQHASTSHQKVFLAIIKSQYFISTKHWLFDFFFAAASEVEATILKVTLWHI